MNYILLAVSVVNILAMGIALHLYTRTDHMKPIVFYFTAKWCNPCKQLLPQVEQLAKENNFVLDVIDIDNPKNSYEEAAIADAGGVRSVPMMALPNGDVIFPMDYRPKSRLTEKILESL